MSFAFAAVLSPEALGAFVDAVLLRARAGVPDAKPWLWPEAIVIADYLLAAEDRDDVQERLDAAIDERPIFPKERKPLGTGAQQTVQMAIDGMKAEFAASRERLTPILGGAAIEKWSDGWTGLLQVAEGLRWLLADEAIQGIIAKGKARKQSDMPAALEREPSQFFYDPRIPVAVRKATWNLIRGVIALLAIQRAYEQRSPITPWLALALAEHFAKGTTGIIPSFVALDGYGTVKAARDAFVDKLAEEARASGRNTYDIVLGDGEGR